MSELPKRIQRKRTKGWRMPDGAVCVTRGTVFGNPWSVRGAIEAGYKEQGAASWCVSLFRDWVDELPGSITRMLKDSDELRARLKADLPRLSGRSLTCWCRLCPIHAAGKPFDVVCQDCAPCHADVLGRMVNGYPLVCDAPPQGWQVPVALYVEPFREMETV